MNHNAIRWLCVSPKRLQPIWDNVPGIKTGFIRCSMSPACRMTQDIPAEYPEKWCCCCQVEGWSRCMVDSQHLYTLCHATHWGQHVMLSSSSMFLLLKSTSRALCVYSYPYLSYSVLKTLTTFKINEEKCNRSILKFLRVKFLSIITDLKKNTAQYC